MLLQVSYSMLATTAAGPLRLEPCGPVMCHKAQRQSRPLPSSNGDSVEPSAVHSLFAYPLESNFSGACYGLDPIQQQRRHGVEITGQGQGACSGAERWHVFLDAAKACATRPPDLAQAPADFVVRARSPYCCPMVQP